MELSKRNKELHLDQEAASALCLLNAGLLSPVNSLMTKTETISVIKTGLVNGKTFPFPFILSPGGKTNETVLSSSIKGERLDLIVDKEVYGHIIVDEIFEINPKERVRQIYGTDDLSHPGVKKTYERIGKFAICGKFEVFNSTLDVNKELINEAKIRVGARHTTAMMMAANPLHRAHERLIRQTLDKTDLIVIFLLKPYHDNDLIYETRKETLDYFITNFLPKNRVVIIPLEHSYIFAGYNEVLIDAIVAQNYGCNCLMIGQNHAGVGMYYDQNAHKSIVDRLIGTNIEIIIAAEYVYCNECKTLVSTNTCPHGQHHHISYHSESILELLKIGLLPPAVLMRKEISALILAKLFTDRFKNLEKLYYDILPIAGLLEEHNEQDFYIELMKLYQTTSLT
ncbi:sulfate adenylyltransferase [Sulfurimonas sp. MAG313]|nr:sulfate adenylyltransferase [Sulfurimonas sp. MAG313]MDF1881373.1 sulfate adenylyltransferase [Sulfurimonas sp. MAG313]